MYSAFNEQLGRPLTRRLDLSSIRTTLWTAWERASGALKSLACLVPLYFESPSLKRGETEAAACSNAGRLLRKCTATNSETELRTRDICGGTCRTRIRCRSGAGLSSSEWRAPQGSRSGQRVSSAAHLNKVTFVLK